MRDPSAAALTDGNGKTLLPPGTEGEAVVARGTYPLAFDQVPYEVRARREADGAITLQCAGCDEATFPLGAGTEATTLLDADGRALVVSAPAVAIGATDVAVDHRLCLVTAGKHGACMLPVHTQLLVPSDDVVEVQRRLEPVRAYGVLMLSLGAAAIAATAYGVFTSHDRNEQAAIAFFGAPPALLVSGVGLWELLAPSHVQTWRQTE